MVCGIPCSQIAWSMHLIVQPSCVRLRGALRMLQPQVAALKPP